MKTVNADTVIFTAPNEGVATGRNGTMRVRGLRAWKSLDGKLVTLEPWTSRGQIGNCRIVVPTAELPQVVGMLKGMLAPETPALLDAAKGVLANWEHGDLAAAVRELTAAVSTAENPAQAAHRLHRGGCCPACGSGDITGYSFEYDGAEHWQEVNCWTCGASWVDVYRLAEFSDLKQKEPAA